MSFVSLYLKNSKLLNIYKIQVEKPSLLNFISKGVMIPEMFYYLFQKFLDFEEAELFEEQKIMLNGQIPDDFIEYQKIKIILAVGA